VKGGISISRSWTGTRPVRSSCQDLLADEIPKLVSALCPRDAAQQGDDDCNELHAGAVELAILRGPRYGAIVGNHPYDITPPPAGVEPNAWYVEAGSFYLRLAREHCAWGPKGSGQNRKVECCDLLSFAKEGFRAGHDPTREAEAAALLDDKTNGLLITAVTTSESSTVATTRCAR
jgi:hypothetical protein